MTTRNVCIALALISAAACGGSYSSGPTSQPPGNQQPPAGGLGIAVTNYAFTPASLTVTKGATVEWAWSTCTGDPYGGTQTCVSHDIVFDDGRTSGPMSQGTYRTSFPASGTYNYHCSVHVAQGMVGSITVP